MKCLFFVLVPSVLFAQAQPVPQGGPKPGWRWTMDSVRTVVNAVRAGRSLQPRHCESSATGEFGLKAG